MSTEFKKEIGLISESPLSRSCTQSAQNGRNQNNLEKKGLKYSLLQKIVTNTILSHAITCVARRKRSTFTFPFVWLSQRYSKCHLQMEFLELLKGVHCIIYMYGSLCLCVIYAHTRPKCNNSLISLAPRELCPKLAPGHRLKTNLTLLMEYHKWNGRC